MLEHHYQNHSIDLYETFMLFCKKTTSSLTSFVRYCKEIVNLLFFGKLGMPGNTYLK